MTPEEDLFETVEEIRRKSFADLSAELVRKIITIEKDFTENRQEANKRILQDIDAHLPNSAATDRSDG
jgi:hypothetical protein